MYVWQKHLAVEESSASFYHRLSRQELVNLFSAPRKMVIEIGSSGGYTGKYCKEKFPQAIYWGFELNKAAAKESLAHLDKVICGKFEEQDLELLGLQPNSVDGVVLGDVLEHMYDPWRALTALLPWLTPDAELVISLPNIRNLWILNEIAEGRFNYEENGLLDVTHIRFFTLQQIHKLLDETGYAISTGTIALDERLTDYHEKNKHVRGPCTLNYGSISIRSQGEAIREWCAKQFIFRARPKPKIHEALTGNTHASRQALIADYDHSFEPDKDHYVASLPARPSNPPVDVRLFAFYLPQYHPTKLNNEWWGDGFTEWTNVARARPSFVGHYQPRHPGELGYYDLRLPEVMDRQVELAKQAGLSGFIFYYYWFSGTRKLEMPLFQYMKRWDELQLPFFVMWCNENWRRTWVDKNQPSEPTRDILLEHQHLPDDPERFIDDLSDILRHPGYLKVDGKPVLLVYPLVGQDGTADIPTTRTIVQRWRKRAHEIGVGDIVIGGLEKSNLLVNGQRFTAESVGIDFLFEFPPNNSLLYSNSENMVGVHSFYESDNQINIIHYRSLVRIMSQPPVAQPLVRTVLAGSWDNTARKGNRANVFHGCTPALYENWLRTAVQDAKPVAALGNTSMVFINAWNEWAEGVYLEPDRKYGYALLAATQRVAFDSSASATPTLTEVPADTPACAPAAEPVG